MFKEWVKILGLLLCFGTANAQPPKLLPQLITEPMKPNNFNFSSGEYMTVGKSDTSMFGRLLWEEQDNLERKILNAFGNIGFGISILDKDVANDDLHLNMNIDITPKRTVIPINFGAVKNGVPVVDPLYPRLDPKSGVLTVDFFQTVFRTDASTSKIITEAIKSKYPIGVGYGFEMGQIVRKVSLLRSHDEFLNSKTKTEKQVTEELQKQFDDLNGNTEPLQGTNIIEGTTENISKIQEVIEDAIKYTLTGLEFAYEGLEKVIQKGSANFEDDEKTKIFFAGLFDSIRLKKNLFTIDAERTLKHLSYGDILSIIQFKNYGPGFGASFGTGSARAEVNRAWLDSHNREIRITRLSPQQCGLTPNKNVCNKVLVSLIVYRGDNNRWIYQTPMKIGPFRYRPFSAESDDARFFQTEWQAEYDLNNPQAIKAFNLSVRQYQPKWNMTYILGKHAQSTGVRLVSYSAIGDSTSEKFDDKSPSSKTSNTRMNLGIVQRNAHGATNTYKKCQTNFDVDGDVINNNAPDQCNFNGISNKNRTYTNRIDLRIKSMPYLDLVLDWRAKQAEQNMCEVYAHLDKKSVHHGVNVHCRYNITDKFSTKEVYQDEYLQSVKTMLGMLEPETQSFYSQSAPDLYNKVMSDNGLSNPQRNIDKNHQNLIVDVLFDDKYTDEIFKNSVEDVKSVIARILLGDWATWKHIEYLPNHATEYPHFTNMGFKCQVNPKYEGMIINKYFAERDMCSEIRRMGFDMLKLFGMMVKSKSPDRMRETMDYYSRNNRKPYLPLLLFMLGKNHSEKLINGNMAINFYYEGEDLPEKRNRIQSGNVAKLASVGFNALPGVNPIPGTGRPRIYNVNVYTEKNGNGNDLHFYLEFYSDLKATISGKPFGLSGKIQEYVPVFADVEAARFSVDRLIPEEIKVDDGVYQYRYVVKLSNLETSGLKPNKTYVGIFHLEDPDIVTNGEKEHFSEMVEYLVSFDPKKLKH